MEGDDINLDYRRTDTKNYTAKLIEGVAHVNLESALGPISIYAILQLHMTVLQLHKLVYFQLGITHIKVNTSK